MKNHEKPGYDPQTGFDEIQPGNPTKMLFFDRRAGVSGSGSRLRRSPCAKKEIAYYWEKWVCRLDPLGFEIDPFY